MSTVRHICGFAITRQLAAAPKRKGCASARIVVCGGGIQERDALAPDKRSTLHTRWNTAEEWQTSVPGARVALSIETDNVTIGVMVIEQFIVACWKAQRLSSYKDS
jgi:hypothetical protein